MLSWPPASDRWLFYRTLHRHTLYFARPIHSALGYHTSDGVPFTLITGTVELLCHQASLLYFNVAVTRSMIARSEQLPLKSSTVSFQHNNSTFPIHFG